MTHRAAFSTSRSFADTARGMGRGRRGRALRASAVFAVGLAAGWGCSDAGTTSGTATTGGSGPVTGGSTSTAGSGGAQATTGGTGGTTGGASMTGGAGGSTGGTGGTGGSTGGSSGTGGGTGGSTGATGGTMMTTGGAAGTGGTSMMGGAAGTSDGMGGAAGTLMGGGGRSMGGNGGSGGLMGGGGMAAGTGGTGGSGSCQHQMMTGNNFLSIGDSWIQIPGTQITHLEDYLKAAGVLGSSDKFDRREVSGAPISSIISQYTGKDTSNAKILVMDGGGIDLFSTAAGDQNAITPVVQKFKDFLQKVKDDGHIQHIIYSLYPVIPTTKNLNVNMKPGFTDACNNSPVDCHLVDLEPLFMGQHFAGDNTHPDEMGAQIIAKAWWAAMQANCIAQ